MSKIYQVEVKFGQRWTLLQSFTRHTDALHYIKEHSGERYPLRILRIVRTVVFEGK